MTKIIAVMIAGLLAKAALGAEPETPKLPEPQQEHAWLMQWVGEWDAEVEMFKEPGMSPEKSQGAESVRAIGGFWTLGREQGRPHRQAPHRHPRLSAPELSARDLWFELETGKGIAMPEMTQSTMRAVVIDRFGSLETLNQPRQPQRWVLRRVRGGEGGTRRAHP
jgi:hypothetical protein